jgi:hypothetical protein
MLAEGKEEGMSVHIPKTLSNSTRCRRLLIPKGFSAKNLQSSFLVFAPAM